MPSSSARKALAIVVFGRFDFQSLSLQMDLAEEPEGHAWCHTLQ